MPLRRLLVAAAALVAVAAALVVAAVRSSPIPARSTRPAGTIPTGAPLPLATAIPSAAPRCSLPTRVDPPAWYPADLPLPGGSYASQILRTQSGYDRSVFVVPGSLPELTRFGLSEWPKHGWTLGRGDAEESEVEDSFEKAP